MSSFHQELHGGESESISLQEVYTVFSDLLIFLFIIFVLLFAVQLNDKHSPGFMEKFSKEMSHDTRPPAFDANFVTALQAYISQNHLSQDVELVIKPDRIKLRLSQPVLFLSGDDQLAPEAKRAIFGLVPLIKKGRYKVIVEGHTDNQPLHGGKFASNWELSFHRSFSVVKLFADSGIDPRRLSALGHGEFQPIAPNNNESNRKKNRRIEISFVP